MAINNSANDLNDVDRRAGALNYYFKFKFNFDDFNIFPIHDVFWKRFNNAIEQIVAEARVLFDGTNVRVLRDQTKAFEIVKDNGFAIGICSFDLLKNFDLAMGAVTNEPFSYFFLDEVLQHDSGIAWLALKQEPKMFECLPKKIKTGTMFKLLKKYQNIGGR